MQDVFDTTKDKFLSVKDLNKPYKGFRDGYDIIGDCQYEADENGWWDFACTDYWKGPIPKKLEDIVKYTSMDTRIRY